MAAKNAVSIVDFSRKEVEKQQILKQLVVRDRPPKPSRNHVWSAGTAEYDADGKLINHNPGEWLLL